METKNLSSYKAEFERIMADFDLGLTGNDDIVSWFEDVLLHEKEFDEQQELYKEREKLLEPLANKICKIMMSV